MKKTAVLFFILILLSLTACNKEAATYNTVKFTPTQSQSTTKVSSTPTTAITLPDNLKQLYDYEWQEYKYETSEPEVYIFKNNGEVTEGSLRHIHKWFFKDNKIYMEKGTIPNEYSCKIYEDKGEVFLKLNDTVYKGFKLDYNKINTTPLKITLPDNLKRLYDYQWGEYKYETSEPEVYTFKDNGEVFIMCFMIERAYDWSFIDNKIIIKKENYNIEYNCEIYEENGQIFLKLNDTVYDGYKLKK